MNKFLVFMFAPFMLTACATSSSLDDIVSIGPDTYMVGRPGGFTTFTGAEVKTQLYKDANEFCRRQNKYLMTVSSSSRNSGVGTYANAELQFRCLSSGDRDLYRPTMERVPDMTIQVK